MDKYDKNNFDRCMKSLVKRQRRGNGKDYFLVVKRYHKVLEDRVDMNNRYMFSICMDRIRGEDNSVAMGCIEKFIIRFRNY